MLYGTVKYGLKAGGEKEVDWAARAKLVKEDGKVKMAFYQVYLVGLFVVGRGGRCGLTVNFRIRVRRNKEWAGWAEVGMNVMRWKEGFHGADWMIVWEKMRRLEGSFFAILQSPLKMLNRATNE
jgi:hypothetical protein